MFHVPEKCRIVTGPLASNEDAGNNGAFSISSNTGTGRTLLAIASDGGGWEHVSIQAVKGNQSQTPLWDEMCQIKDLFWDETDVVMQLHPAKSEYVNNHPNVLHLWRPTDQTIPTPPSIMVGVKGWTARP